MKNYKAISEKQDELIAKLQSMVDSGQEYDMDYHEIWIELQALKQEPDEKKYIITACNNWIPDKGTSATRCANCGKDRWEHSL